MNNTFVWVLRVAPLEFLAGVVALLGGVYLAFSLPIPDPSAAFVPAASMFGIWPYVVMALVGAILIVAAWHKGAAWKTGKVK